MEFFNLLNVDPSSALSMKDRYDKALRAAHKLDDDATFTFCTKDNEYYILANTYTLFSRALPPASLSL